MNRVTNIFIVAVFLATGWGSAAGQDAEPLVGIEHEVEAARKLMRKERKLVIAGELFLTREESKAFWPIYNEYEATLRPISDARLKLITDYADHFDHMTAEYAERLLKQSFAIDSRFDKARRSYVGKFKKVLPVIKVVRLYQIENKLNAVVNFQLAAKIPLVQEADPEIGVRHQ